MKPRRGTRSAGGIRKKKGGPRMNGGGEMWLPTKKGKLGSQVRHQEGKGLPPTEVNTLG